MQDISNTSNHSLNINGLIVKTDTPVVMGILNTTPDSFYAKSRHENMDLALGQVAGMISHGAGIIDIGAASSRPGANLLSPTEEMDRLLPVLDKLHNEFPDTPFSVDTFHSEVARQAIAHGASLINDISAGDFDEKMLEVVARAGVPYVIMHMQGTPQTMQQNPTYTDVVQEVIYYLASRLKKCRDAGINDVIIDPGFGFGKDLNHNFSLLKHLSEFKILESNILIGLSRKSIICKPLKCTPSNALNGTSALHMVALQNGASILRVHDVKEAVEVIKLHLELSAAK